jgi:HAD superfamily hydrolase (TIGR01509 family)
MSFFNTAFGPDGKYRAAIFDLDGTLADSMHAWDHICRYWLTAKGIAAEDSLEQDIAKMSVTQSAEYVIRAYGIALAPSQIQAEWTAMVLRQYAETIPLKEGAADLVRALGAAGMKLAIATSCFPAACEAILGRCRLRDCFSVVMYTDEAGRDKTFPDLYLACARRLETAPESCVVFEDFPPALSGVRAAGMGMAAVYDAHTAGQWDDFKSSADYAVHSFRELLL